MCMFLCFLCKLLYPICVFAHTHTHMTNVQHVNLSICLHSTPIIAKKISDKWETELMAQSY